MKAVLIHIGTRKTGSTSTQNMLADAREDISHIRYILIGRDRNQNRLITLYPRRNQWPLHWHDVDAETCRRYCQFISADFSSPGDAMISGAALSRWLTPAAVQALMDSLESFGFRRFHLTLYLRDPADYYLSDMQ
jgi:hypothetical protein